MRQLFEIYVYGIHTCVSVSGDVSNADMRCNICVLCCCDVATLLSVVVMRAALKLDKMNLDATAMVLLALNFCTNMAVLCVCMCACVCV